MSHLNNASESTTIPSKQSPLTQMQHHHYPSSSSSQQQQQLPDPQQQQPPHSPNPSLSEKPASPVLQSTASCLSLESLQLLHCIIHKTHVTCRSLPYSTLGSAPPQTETNSAAHATNARTSSTYSLFLKSIKYLLGECDSDGASIGQHRYFSENIIRELWMEMESRRQHAAQQHITVNNAHANNHDPQQHATAPVTFMPLPFEYNTWRLKFAIMRLFPNETHSFTRIAQECFPRLRLLRLFAGNEHERANGPGSTSKSIRKIRADSVEPLPSNWKDPYIQRGWQKKSFAVFLEALRMHVPKEGSMADGGGQHDAASQIPPINTQFSIIQANPFTFYLHEQVFTHAMRSFMGRCNDLLMVDEADWQNIFAQSISMHLQKLREVHRAVEQVQQYKTSLVRFMKNAFSTAESASSPQTLSTPNATPIFSPESSAQLPPQSATQPAPHQTDAALKEAFSRFSNGGEEIVFDDFRKGLHQYCGVAATDETLILSRDMFNAMDEDASGSIDLNEFRGYMLEEADLTDLKKDIVRKSPDGNLEEFFRRLTPTNKVRVVYMELLNGLLLNGVTGYSETLIRRFFVTLDTDATGEVLLHDFVFSLKETQSSMQENEAKKKKSVQPRLIGAKWTVHRDAHGNRFYFNHQTGKSSWHKPKELRAPGEKTCSWKEFKNAKGISYFYNKKTKESSWIIPPRLEQYMNHLRRNGYAMP